MAQGQSRSGKSRAVTPRPASAPLNLFDYEEAAKRKLSPAAWAYISGGAADEITLRWNRQALERIVLWPRVLVDVSRIDTSVRLLGEKLAFPILLAPAAMHRIAHREGEVATARGAGEAGALLIVSSAATTAIEDIARAASGPLWFQLYVQRDRGFTRALVERVEAAGCRALCLTVDTPVIGIRDREVRAGYGLPPGLKMPNLLGAYEETNRAPHRPSEEAVYSAALEPALTWKDIAWLRSFARVPIVLKGILHPDDAERAIGEGAGGIIVSNHGARNLDTTPATIDALPRIAERIGGRIPMLMDGGIRRGTDVLKALALGANAVLIGRPYLYALAVEGAAGVARSVRLLHRELVMAMALAGKTSLAMVDRSLLFAG